MNQMWEDFKLSLTLSDNACNDSKTMSAAQKSHRVHCSSTTMSKERILSQKHEEDTRYQDKRRGTSMTSRSTAPTASIMTYIMLGKTLSFRCSAYLMSTKGSWRLATTYQVFVWDSPISLLSVESTKTSFYWRLVTHKRLCQRSSTAW